MCKHVYPVKAYWLRDAPTRFLFKNCTFCPHSLYVFCIYLRTNSDLCHLQHKLIGFYKRVEKCLLRVTDWVFKLSSLPFVFQWFIILLINRKQLTHYLPFFPFNSWKKGQNAHFCWMPGMERIVNWVLFFKNDFIIVFLWIFSVRSNTQPVSYFWPRGAR